MRRKNVDLEPMDESVVKRIAHIIGPMSAAQKALDKAAEIRARGNVPLFWHDSANNATVVQETEA